MTNILTLDQIQKLSDHRLKNYRKLLIVEKLHLKYDICDCCQSYDWEKTVYPEGSPEEKRINALTWTLCRVHEERVKRKSK